MAQWTNGSLIDPRFLRGLPAGLVENDPSDMPTYGFKGVPINALVLTAKVPQATMPAASFSRSKEFHNQDKGSMGSKSAREAMRVCDLVEHVVAICLMTAAQGCDMQSLQASRTKRESILNAERAYRTVVTQDRCLDEEIMTLARALRAGSLQHAVHQ